MINLSVNGKRHRIPAKTKDEKLALERLALLRKGILDGTISLHKEETNKKTFEHYSEIYLRTIGVGDNTLANYTYRVNIWKTIFKDRDITTIKTSEIKEKIFSMDLKPNTFKNHLANLKGIFDEACLDDVLNTNPCNKIKVPKGISEEIFPFEEEEVAAMLNNASGWFRNFLAVAFYTGARTGELFALKWQNIDLNKKRIYINASRGDYKEGSTKTGKSRYVPIFEPLVSYLQDQRLKTGMKTYVFLTDYGKNLHPSNVTKFQWKPLLKRLNIPYRTLYMTRHTFATTMLNTNKYSLNEIASMLGHSTIQMLIKHYNKYIKDQNSKIDTDFDPFCQNICQTVSRSA